MLLYRLKWRGVARIRGKRSDALGERTQKCPPDLATRKLDPMIITCLRKLPGVSNFAITRPAPR